MRMGISDSIQIDAMNAGMAIPWTVMSARALSPANGVANGV
jgi:hypothetical protein